MSLLAIRGAILAQGGATAPPVDIGSAWQLDATRRPAGYTLADGDRTAVNTSGGSDYRRWVPTVRAILPSDGRRYWEVLCAPGGAAAFDGYLGVVSAAMHPHFDTGWNPISGASIGWRGNGTLWSTNAAPSASSTQQLSGLPGFGAGDVAMFVLDPAAASLWIGLNGTWRDDPVGGAASAAGPHHCRHASAGRPARPDRGKTAWRTQITGADLSVRLARTLRSEQFPRGKPSLNAAELVWSKAPVIVGAHDTGPLIRSETGFWLVIPSPAAG